MSERGDKDFLRDIQEAVRRIGAYLGAMPYEAFVEDTKTQDAVIRNLEVIGEATKNLSGELRTRHSDIPWRSMAGVRDRLIHDYFGINLDIVWHIATAELPAVTSRIAEIIGEE
jgi:uncharacterized protein with HEPN domain